ncbi:MAG TPA: SRPBCC family protein [Chthoniobacterales bacterium]
MAGSSFTQHWQGTSVKQLAKGLGCFSVALGCAEIFAPDWLAEVVGIRSRPLLIGALGLRELTSGLGILGQDRPTGWMWSRVVGDAIDLALLEAAREERDSDGDRVVGALAAVAGVTVIDLLCALLLRRETPEDTAHVVQTITIGRSPEELFNFWRDFENLPQVMRNLESVRQIDDRRSHWVARGPGGRTLQWEAKITDERPNEYISWRSRSGAFPHSGTVRFVPAPGERGTIVRVELDYEPPGGSLGRTVARLFGQAPEQKIQLDLYRMKQILETGVVMTTEGQPAGRSSSTSSVYDWGTTRG